MKPSKKGAPLPKDADPVLRRRHELLCIAAAAVAAALALGAGAGAMLWRMP
jgi:hypothetical protein